MHLNPVGKKKASDEVMQRKSKSTREKIHKANCFPERGMGSTSLWIGARAATTSIEDKIPAWRKSTSFFSVTMDLTQSPVTFFVAAAEVAAESTKILSFVDWLVEEISVVEEILVRDAMAKEKHMEGKGIKEERTEEDKAEGVG